MRVRSPILQHGTGVLLRGGAGGTELGTATGLEPQKPKVASREKAGSTMFFVVVF